LLFLASILASFRPFLASFWVRFSTLFLCFQGLLSFVPTIFHILEFPAFPCGRSEAVLVRASGQGGHSLRRIVPGLTTSLGYHGSGVLSSENGYDVKAL